MLIIGSMRVLERAWSGESRGVDGFQYGGLWLVNGRGPESVLRLNSGSGLCLNVTVIIRANASLPASGTDIIVGSWGVSTCPRKSFR